MKKYLLLQPDEDGNPTAWLEDAEVKNIKQLMVDYGITKFLSSLPENDDPNYWNEGDAILLRVEICKVKPVKVVEKYEIETTEDEEERF